jgi:AGCS family alanine or glycine:cation symporter
VGSIVSLAVAWDFANFANGLMILPNIASLLLLRKVVVAETRKYLWENRLDESDPECMENQGEVKA